MGAQQPMTRTINRMLRRRRPPLVEPDRAVGRHQRLSSGAAKTDHVNTLFRAVRALAAQQDSPSRAHGTPRAER